ncbi:hypothetical protein Tsubulata_020982 [Turnera subulata]|uniref:Uncharacterized protein n=1 Tax=Turnera subulata TaxID=218843 RepID=A0A9Q0F9Q6_9ROSI|nr:hypothetical protein Tsubulata_020982 [Turnera subulata]
MARLIGLPTNLPRYGPIGVVVIRSPWSSRVFVPVSTRRFQANCRKEASDAIQSGVQAAKQGVNQAKTAAQDIKNTATSTAGEVTQKAKEVTGEASTAAQDITEKAKKTAEDAWGSVKDTTQKIKDTVVGKADETKAFVKDNAEAVKRNMNTKN